ncbi:hypothetical protein RB195_019950 [Necator americanus]|uniref:Mos1 transposase HTH domain-containing protein n=1 Tax=Necator americanus TaxID=51031 RepID=A0ABR1CGI4_NECAM
MPRNFNPSSLHHRNVILFLHLSGQEPADIDRRLKEVYKEHAPARSTVYKYHSKLATGDYSIEDEDSSVTGDGKWISYSNIHRRAQWVDKGTDAEDVRKLNVHAKKVMLFI